MNDSYFTQASNYAKQEAEKYRSTFDSTLDNLLNISNLEREKVTANYNNLLNQINANRTSLQEQYKTNARQAYVNKLLADQQTTDTLSRMNLNQSGFRLTQDTLNNNQYSSNLNQLALAEDAGNRDLDLQQLNALNNYNTGLLDIDLDYNSKYASLMQQIDERVNDYQNNIYKQYYADLQYQDQLKQQALENQLNQQKINLSAQSGGGSSGGTGINPFNNDDNNTMTPIDSTSNFNPNTKVYIPNVTSLIRLSSSKADNWLRSLTSYASTNGITQGELVDRLQKAYNKGTLTDKDVTRISNLLQSNNAFNEGMAKSIAAGKSSSGTDSTVSNTSKKSNSISNAAIKGVASVVGGSINPGASVAIRALNLLKK